MPSRSRSQDLRVNDTGSYTNIPLKTTTTRSVLNGIQGTCTDFVGNPQGVNPLDLTKRYCNVPGLDGVYVDPVSHTVTKIMSNFPLGWQDNTPDPRSQFPALTVLEKSNLSWSLLSKANPSTPEVSVPTFLAELRDIPSLMKSWYGLFARPKWRSRRTYAQAWTKIFARAPEMIAAGHLSWRWAIAPFIRDVRNMLGFQKAMAKRLRLLNDLSTGRRTIRRRVQLRTDVKLVNTARILHSEGVIINGFTHDRYTEKVWGSIRYSLLPNVTPLSSVVFMDDDAKHELAFRLTFGITSYETLSAAWELMPWSWLIDWFTGFGTVLSATNNTLGLFNSHACLMRHTQCETTVTRTPSAGNSWVKLNRFYRVSYERKERFPASTVLPFAPSYLPLLTRKAGLILGSLFILKVRPGNSLERNLSKLLVRK